MLPLACGAPSAVAPQERDWDLLLTAETHNFPCAVAPYPGMHLGAFLNQYLPLCSECSNSLASFHFGKGNSERVCLVYLLCYMGINATGRKPVKGGRAGKVSLRSMPGVLT